MGIDFLKKDKYMNKEYLYGTMLCLFALCLCTACDALKSEDGVLDRPIAKVQNKTLKTSDLEDIVPEGMSGEDSSLIAQAYVQRWTKEALMQYEAGRNVPKELNIDQLVRNYRASLIRMNYEEQIIGNRIDSTIMESELLRYYEDNKDQFQLDNTILRINLLKVPSDAPQGTLNSLWYSSKAEDKQALKEFANKWASVALLNDEQWLRLEAIGKLLPKDALNIENIAKRKEGVLKDDNSLYYFRVLETVRGKQTAPFEYARDQAMKVILHKRKQKLIEDWKEELYQKALKSKAVEIF